MRRVVPAIGLILLFSVAALPQTRERARSGTTKTQTPNLKQSDQDPLPAFDGVVRAIDSRLLTIERPDSQSLDFNCTRKTKYFDGKKTIKGSALQSGDHVSVETKRAPDGSLDAVNVYRTKLGKTS